VSIRHHAAIQAGVSKTQGKVSLESRRALALARRLAEDTEESPRKRSGIPKGKESIGPVDMEGMKGSARSTLVQK